MVCDGSLVPQPSDHPLPGAVRVGHRLQRGKSLGRHDEERFGWIEGSGCLNEISRIHVGNKAKSQRPVAVIPQRFISHYRSEIGAANPDVDNVADRFAGISLPFAAPDTVGEARHLVEHGMYLRHNILAIYYERCASRRS
jgi:hypothetical protein